MAAQALLSPGMRCQRLLQADPDKGKRFSPPARFIFLPHCSSDASSAATVLTALTTLGGGGEGESPCAYNSPLPRFLMQSQPANVHSF